VNRRLVLLLAFVIGAVMVPVATAGPIIDKAASALRSDPVYIADDSVGFSQDQIAEMRQQIKDGSRPVFVAVLPAAAVDEAGGDTRLVSAVGTATGLSGTYVVLAGSKFRVKSSNSANFPQAEGIAGHDFQKYKGDGKVAVVMHTVQDIVNYKVATVTPGANGPEGRGGSSKDSGGFPWWIVILLGAIALVAGVWGLLRRSGSQSKFRARKTALESRLYENDYGVTVKGAAANGHLQSALSLKDSAATALAGAQTMDDLDAVESLLDKSEGHYRDALAESRSDDPEPAPVSASPARSRQKRSSRAKTKTTARSKPVPLGQRPQPTQTATNVNVPGGGMGYGYYPGYGGWGYFDPLGYFILGELAAGGFDSGRDDAGRDDSNHDASGNDDFSTVGGGGGDFGSGNEGSSGGGGGGDFGSPEPAPSYSPPSYTPPEPAPSYDPPSYDPPDFDFGGGGGGGGDFGGGGDSGGGGGGGDF
jgi:hypothetical protein